jgi:ABC-type phosphate transport system substrate-binding protein
MDDVVVIVHPSVVVDRLDVTELRAIFLGSMTRWSDGSSIVPITMSVGPVQQAFVEGVLEKRVDLFTRYWLHIAFHGRGVPPRAVSQEAVVVAFVAATPGAVGYVSARESLVGVKVLEIAGL